MSISISFPLGSYKNENEIITALNDSFKSPTVSNNNNNASASASASALSEPKPFPLRRTKTRRGHECSHTQIQDNICTNCNRRVDTNFSAQFNPIRKGLALNPTDMADAREFQSNEILKKNKLVLVLDLDKTLLQDTTLPAQPTPSKAESSKPPKFQSIPNPTQKTKQLRSFAQNFLKDASEMFEFYIYTTSIELFDLTMKYLPKPKQEAYLGWRIIHRDNSGLSDEKSLEPVLAAEQMVLVLDDTEENWMKPNLVSIKGYVNEKEAERTLTKSLTVLQNVHYLFFHNQLMVEVGRRDVRVILRVLRGKVLQGCKLLFSDMGSDGHRFRTMATDLGAVCVPTLDESVTHVVSLVESSEESRRAKQRKNTVLVHPRWVQLAYYMLERMPEKDYPISPQTKLVRGTVGVGAARD